MSGAGTAVTGERASVALLRAKKARGEPIVMLTAYDFPSAQVAAAAGVDVILVGDSAAMTTLGYPSTREVSLDEMLMLARAARRGAPNALLVGDLPIGTYEDSDAQALATSRRFVDEAGCDLVKIERAGPIADRARALTAAGIPVMGHVGLTPQTSEYRVQGKSLDRALEIAREAAELEHAGCVAIVFEAIPAAVVELIVRRLTVPVIGIGAGGAADGQVLVFNDLLGMNEGRVPRFVKRYASLNAEMIAAVRQWADDVRTRRYPGPEHTYAIEPAELEAVRTALDRR